MSGQNGDGGTSCSSVLDRADDAHRVNFLLYCSGEEAEGVLSLTGISEQSRKKYTDVITKLEEHFRARRNVIYEQECSN